MMIDFGATLPAIPAPPTPAGWVTLVAGEDATERVPATDPEERLAHLVGAAIGLRYRDAKGRETRRRITIRRIETRGGDDLYVHAWCHERRAARCFSLPRMIEVVDLRTGEVFADPAAFFRPPVTVAIRDGEVPTATVLEYCHHGLNLLAFVGRADGRYDADEQEWMLEYVRDRLDYQAFDAEAVAVHISRLHPDPEVADGALAAIAERTPAERRRFLRYLRRLIEADGVLDAHRAIGPAMWRGKCSP